MVAASQQSHKWTSCALWDTYKNLDLEPRSYGREVAPYGQCTSKHSTRRIIETPTKTFNQALDVESWIRWIQPTLAAARHLDILLKCSRLFLLPL